MNTNDLAPQTMMCAKDHVAQRAAVFVSNDSFLWFCRRHRDELVAAGALLMPTGRWLVHVERFDSVVAEVGARRATERGRALR